MGIFSVKAGLISLTAITGLATSAAAISVVELKAANDKLVTVESKVKTLTENETKYKSMLAKIQENGDAKISEVIAEGDKELEAIATKVNDLKADEAKQKVDEVNTAISTTKDQVDKLDKATQNVTKVEQAEIDKANDRFTDADPKYSASTQNGNQPTQNGNQPTQSGN